MSLTLFTSEFTDISNEDWEIKIVSQGTASDWGKVFKVGPDGFRLNYDFDQYDRCKPVIGSRVQLTMYQDDTETTSFEAFYDLLSSVEEGLLRIEIYKDQDATNTLFWVGEILPEQTIIPDEFPNAAITLTAVDGLANLKGIKYNNDGTAYAGSVKVLDHLHNVIQKLHVSEIWTATDVELKFFEDFIGKEYKDSIGTAQNKQLQNAKISQDTYYNKDEDGDPQFYSCYEVLESLALSFNACVFMSEGSIWWVPLGAIQSHASSGLSIANYMLGNGTVTYNTVANTTIGAIFGSNSSQWEKLAGWERTTAPAFKEVKRTRDFFGDQPVVKDSNYTRADILASTILDDEDVEYPAGRKFLVSGTLRYEYPGDGTAVNGDKIARLKIGVRVRVGDAAGADRYLLRATTYNTQQTSYANYFDSSVDTNENDFFYKNANHIDAAWSASASNYEIISGTFNKRTGTDGNQNGAIFISFSFLTPEIAAATGLQISLDDFTGIDKDGADDSDLIGASAQFSVADFQAHIFDENQSQEFGTVDITATNPDTARYHFNQGNTLIGDRVTDADLGTIQISNGSVYLDSSEWTNLQSSTASLSINGLGVRERLASNEDAKRVERGTLFKRGSTWIHPYTILTNTEHSSNFYQVSSLIFIAARSEYDLECMYLSRNITGITVANDNSKGTPGGGLPDVLPGIKGPGPDIIVSDNTTKLAFISTDTYGITTVKTSTGSSQTAINLPSEKATAGVELVSISTAGAMAPVADGASGEFLKTNGSGVLSWSTAGGGGGGWFGSTSLMKVMPSEFMSNDDIKGSFVVVEDDVTNSLGVRVNNSASELYAFIAIPTGYKATYVQVYASASTTSAVEIKQFNQTTGAISNEGSGDFNAAVNFTDISSSTTNNIVIKLIPASFITVIYGADITIAAI
jgi:hypothetical protein